ncbi:MAG: hypothetical protein N3A63_08545 [Bacteroidetes bacterium]|nr:hypothetical protein [Bacteroidota bacterium]
MNSYEPYCIERMISAKNTAKKTEDVAIKVRRLLRQILRHASDR